MAWIAFHPRARRVRRCPECGARAVAAIERDPVEPGKVELRLRCGACWAWRTATMSAGAAAAFDRRLSRDLERMRIGLEQGARQRAADLERLTRS
jgi:hypothetical protein